jgi:hypothetical protein
LSDLEFARGLGIHENSRDFASNQKAE